MPVIEVHGPAQALPRPRRGARRLVRPCEEGEIFGVCGPNGAGKTTTVECIGGLRVPDGGTISVLGLDPQRDRDRAAPGARRPAAGERAARAAAGAARPSSCSPRSTPNPADPGELIERWGLGAKRKTAFGKLSGGQKQRLSIVLALVGNPRVAILDELTTGLDPQARRDTWAAIEQIRDSGVTVVLVTHFMEEAERLCDRIAVIDAGRVVAIDTPAGLVGEPPRRAAAALPPVRARSPTACSPRCPRSTPCRAGATQVEVTGRGDLLHGRHRRAGPPRDRRRRPAHGPGRPRRRLRRADRPRGRD